MHGSANAQIFLSMKIHSPNVNAHINLKSANLSSSENVVFSEKKQEISYDSTVHVYC